MNLSRKTMYLLAGWILLLTISCSGDSESDIATLLQDRGIVADMTSTGLYYTIDREGSGIAPTASSFIVMRVTQLDINGNVITRQDEKFPAAIDVATLFPGLREGVQLMKAGGTATFYITPDLSGGNINSGVVIYSIYLQRVYDSLAEYNDGEITSYLDSQGISATRTSTGLYYAIEEPGDDNRPQLTSTVTIHYRGYFINGDIFDSSYARETPSTFTLSGLIQGWQEGIPLFGTGGKGQLFIPSQLAYGANGSQSIPPNYPIVFDIELIEHR